MSGYAKEHVTVTVNLNDGASTAERECFYEKLKDLGLEKRSEASTAWTGVVETGDGIGEFISPTGNQLAKKIREAARECGVNVSGIVQVGNSEAVSICEAGE